MAFEDNAAKLAATIERARQRIAERELRIAHLDGIGADTWTLREVLATSRQNLELLEYLYKLAHSFAELAADKQADLEARIGIVLPPPSQDARAGGRAWPA
ncbi:MAG TPA: hypothetical protein VJV39_12390 [Dongiaceae bacterium]|nr:hypothetical protein [Dongiaceae bacterium]